VTDDPLRVSIDASLATGDAVAALLSSIEKTVEAGGAGRRYGITLELLEYPPRGDGANDEGP